MSRCVLLCGLWLLLIGCSYQFPPKGELRETATLTRSRELIVSESPHVWNTDHTALARVPVPVITEKDMPPNIPADERKGPGWSYPVLQFLSFSPDGQFLATAGRDWMAGKHVNVWRTSTCQHCASFRGVGQSSERTTFSSSTKAKIKAFFNADLKQGDGLRPKRPQSD